MFGIILGKLVIMPAIGVGTAMLLRYHILSIPEDIDASFYLVVMLVMATPTANNVMVMAELGGQVRSSDINPISTQLNSPTPVLISCGSLHSSQSKEAMAMSIFSQYICAPVVLTASTSVIVTIASGF